MSLEEEFSNVLAIGSDRDAALRKGMRSFFPLARGYLAKNTWRMSHENSMTCVLEIRIRRSSSWTFLELMGIVDVSSSQEFDAHLESLYPVWVKREMEARALSKEATTEFTPIS